MKFLFACGGTAGHINPAISIAKELKRLMPDAGVLFVGSGRRLENRLVPLEGFDIVNLNISGLSRGLSPKSIAENVKAIKKLASSGREAVKILEEFKPDAVIGTGGYVCYPVIKNAARMNIRTVLHESNAVPGLTTKLLSGCASRLLVSFEGTEQLYRKPENVILTGTPVREDFFEAAGQAVWEKPDADRPLAVSFWGSLGAGLMNLHTVEFVKKNIESGRFHHIHATGGGEQGLEDFMTRLRGAGVKELPGHIDIRPYIDDMPQIMAAADIILCRAGASTLAELTVLGKPAILVPSPYVTNNHQEENAKRLRDVGGALMLRESECSGGLLYDEAEKLCGAPEVLVGMAKAQRKAARPDALKKIVEIILSL